MRLSRHAKNQARRYGWTETEVKRIVASTAPRDEDDQRRPRYIGEIRGQIVRVVVAVDVPDLIVTIHPRRHR
jgi:hypothetical protein